MSALLSVCPSLIADALIFQGVDRLGRFMAQSMAYGPETLIPLIQGRREGVKGVTVSRGPVIKRGPGEHGIKRKT